LLNSEIPRYFDLVKPTIKVKKELGSRLVKSILKNEDPTDIGRLVDTLKLSFAKPDFLTIFEGLNLEII
jgi:hypothetical protein